VLVGGEVAQGDGSDGAPVPSTLRGEVVARAAFIAPAVTAVAVQVAATASPRAHAGVVLGRRGAVAATLGGGGGASCGTAQRARGGRDRAERALLCANCCVPERRLDTAQTRGPEAPPLLG
jgi:hypothetical protein